MRDQLKGESSMPIQKYQHLKKVDYRRALLAYLISQGFTYKEASGKLPKEIKNTSATTVHRDKETAKIRRWVITRFAEELFEQAILDKLREDAHHLPWHELEKKLRKLSGGILKSIWVFYSGDKEKPDSQIEWDWQMGSFARNSDWFILKLLRSSKSGVAVGWGKTIANSIVAVTDRIRQEKVSRPNGRKTNRLIIPTIATPPGASPDEIEKSSTRLAQNLSEALNGSWKDVLSLEGFRLFLHRKYNVDERQTILNYIRDGALKTILGNLDASAGEYESESETPLIRIVDTILTSVGAFHVEQFFVKELVNTGLVSKEELERLALGDIGGVLIPREETENNRRDKDRFDEILGLWTGIRIEDYQDVAERAAATGDPYSPAGSIICALNASKAEIVYELVRRKATSVLVVDYHLANRLESLLAEKGNKQR
jgi:hypothetical protein